MTLTIEGQYLIHLLRAVLQGIRPPQPPAALDWDKFYRLAAFHHVSAMASYAIDQLPSEVHPNPELMKRFHIDRSVAIAREAHQHVHLEHMLQVFRSHGVACLPLKGCLLKELYPRAEMRLMVDLDLLVDDQQVEKVHELMLALGYTLRSRGETHDVYVKNPFMTVEIHRRLMPTRVAYHGYFDQVWSRVAADESGEYQLPHEDFYIYLIAHLAKHCVGGGIGIRSVMDVWLYHQRHGQDASSEYTRSELQRIGLREFAEHIEALGRVWFGGEPGDRWLEELASFVFSSGSSGTKRNAIMVDAAKSSKNELPFALARCMNILKLLFPQLQTMQGGYPWLHNLPVLLPMAWAWRGVRSLLRKGRGTLQVLKATIGVTELEAKRVREFHRRLGLMD